MLVKTSRFHYKVQDVILNTSFLNYVQYWIMRHHGKGLLFEVLKQIVIL